MSTNDRNKLAASLRLLSKRVAALEVHLGMAPAPNPMHRPDERGEAEYKTRLGEDHGNNTADR